MSHFVHKCIHGHVVRQCRCPGGTITIVKCPDSCGYFVEAPPYNWEEEDE